MPVRIRQEKYDPMPWEKMSDGRYWSYVAVGKVGHKLDYIFPREDGRFEKQTEVVTEEGLFKKDSVESLGGLPVLLKHPRQKYYNLNKEGLKVGTLLNKVVREDGLLLMEALIDDYRAIDLIDRMRERGETPEASSCYYLDDLIFRSDGVWEQIRGLYNHIACPLRVGGGRGGADLSMRLDHHKETEDSLNLGISENLFKKFYLIRSDGKEEKSKVGVNISIRSDSGVDQVFTEVDPILAAEINRIQSENQKLRSDIGGIEEVVEEKDQKLHELNTKIGELTGTVASLETKLEQADTRLDSKTLDDEVVFRLDTWDKAIPALTEHARANNLEFKINPAWNSDQIKEFYVKTLDPATYTRLDSIAPEGDDYRAATFNGAWLSLLSVKSQPSSKVESQNQQRSDAIDYTDTLFTVINEGTSRLDAKDSSESEKNQARQRAARRRQLNGITIRGRS